MRFFSFFLTCTLVLLLVLGANTPRAYAASTFVVTSTADTDGSTCGTTCTLRQAINAANADSDLSEITFDEGVFGSSKQTITSSSTSQTTNGSFPSILEDVRIIGPSTPGSGVTLFDPNTQIGSAFHLSKGNVSLINLTFIGYTGIDDSGFIGSSITASNCTFIGSAIGIYASGNATLTNCTVAGNKEAALVTSGRVMILKSCTIVGDNYLDGKVNVSNTIIAGTVDNQKNLEDAGQNIIVASAAAAGLDPNGLQDNGGPTKTIALLYGSPAVDKGTTTLATDQRGVARPQGSAPDIGALEAVGLVAPTATPEPTSAPTATPEPTAVPTATPEPTAVPTATPEPTVTPTPLPVLSIDSPSVIEGNSGTTRLVFTLTLDKPSTSEVSVLVNTSQGTAKSGSDYQSVGRGTVTFPPGTTTQTFTVQVVGDTQVEADESFRLDLRSPSGATLGTSNGTGTIINDDAPTISIDSPSVKEGNKGTTALTFTLTLDKPSTSEVSVLVNTSQGTAKAGSDYVSVGRATVTFPPGTTRQTFTVQVIGDTQVEANESFRLDLRSPVNATLATPSGTGTIINDDSPPKSPSFAGSAPTS